MSEEKKKWKLFDSQREGKGVSKEESKLGPGLKKFWRIYRENFFGRLLSINIMMIVGNFPVIFAVMAYLGVGKLSYTVPSDALFALFRGMTTQAGTQTAGSLAMQGVVGMQTAELAATPWTYVLYGLGALTFLTWGFVCAGSAYVLRNMATDQPIFLLSDFFDTYKKNWRQVLPFGMIDLGILLLLGYNIVATLRGSSSAFMSFLSWPSIVLFLIYFIMRWYIYLQIVSFRLTVWKTVKNALYFVLLGLKRNLMALLGIALMVGVMLFFTFVLGTYFIVIALAIPALMLFSSAGLMANYAAWYKIDEIMVIHDEEKTEKPSDEDAEDSSKEFADETEE